MCISNMLLCVVILLKCGHGKDLPTFRTRKGDILKYHEHVSLTYGEPLELFCAGANSTGLEIMRNEVVMPTEVVNETTIKLFIEKPEKQVSYYECSVKRSPAVFVRVTVDSPPEVKDFRCISKNLEYLNCTWKSSNMRPNFQLYQVKKGQLLLLCNVGSRRSPFCVWDTKRPQYFEFDAKEDNEMTVLMTACSFVGCINETFFINPFAVLKPDPPKDVRVVKRFAYSAVVQWTISYDIYLYSESGLEHKVDYWFYGIKPVEVNTNFKYMQKLYQNYEVDLKLPCANKYYVVRVAIRPKEAEGEEFWSDYAKVSFFTRPEKLASVGIHPICKEEIKENVQVMVYKIAILREQINKEQLEVIEEIRLMKARIARLEMLTGKS